MSDLKHPLVNHLRELRYRVLISIIGSLILAIPIYAYYTLVIEALSLPFQNISSSIDAPLIVTHLFEGFITKVTFALLLGALGATPIHLYNLIRFTFPGLKKKEKVVLITALLSGILLAGLGFYITYFYMLPFSITFLTSFQFIPENVGLLLHFKDNIFYAFRFMCYMMLAFQFPILLEVCLYLNLIQRKKLFKSSRYVIVGIFIFSAIITPPDIITQCGIALPLISLFFITIGIAKVFKWGESDV